VNTYLRVLPLLLVFSGLPVFAEEVGDTIVVTSNREPIALSRVGQSISVLDSAQIAQRQLNTVSDFLREVPGVTVARNGGLGGVTSVYIRGAESDQTAALIDGVKLTDPASPGGGFNFGNLLLGNIERIEVLRGPSSILWGSQAIGGVANMITAAPTEDLRVNARAEGGYRGTAQVAANVSGKLGPLSASVGGGYFRTDGISAFSEARGGAERDGYENYGANAKFNLALSEAVSVDVRGYFSQNEVDIDGFTPSFSFGDTLEFTNIRDLVGYTGLNVALFEGRFRNRLGFAITDTRRRNITPGPVPFETFVSEGRNERLEYQGIFDIADSWQANFGAERETSRFSSSSFGGPVTLGRAQIDSVYGQLVASPVTDLTLTIGVRQDEHDRFGGATTFGASGVYTLAATGTTLRASYSEGFKAPSLFQLQSNFGNQALSPERSRGYDVGVSQSLVGGTLEANATWFSRDSDDLIIFISCPVQAGICSGRPFGTYDNVAKARAQGVELGLVLRPSPAMTVRANYSWIDATNRTAGTPNFGRELPRRPRHSVNMSADYRWAFGLETGVTITHVGASFENASNLTRLEGYVLTDVRAAFDITDRVQVYARVENVFDERYETALNFGNFGRSAYAGVRVRY